MKQILIGRHEEKDLLLKWVNSDRSEFIAVYGRRRVGKTFLVRTTFKEDFSFTFSGSLGLSRKNQLLNFNIALREQFNLPDNKPIDNWIEAFHELKQLLEKSKKTKKIIFIDELPWLDNPKSGFIAALENFWNSWAAWRDDIKLIVCGSATSWIINKIIRDKGGLHNRVTHSLNLKPFLLAECEEYFKTYGFSFTRLQIAECYMAMGGIPYYFSLMDKGESLSQNIENLFFSKDAPLAGEFENLYRSLYKNYNNHIKVVKALSEKGIGLTRKEILAKTGLNDNGEFSRILDELELCGFIRSYLPFNKDNTRRKEYLRNSRDTLYQLIDFYSLFYLRFYKYIKEGDSRFWSNMRNSPKINAWRGLTFEMLCFHHVSEIKKALGISDVSTLVSPWQGDSEGHKAQIDMIIDRGDDCINLCEMKFSIGEFIIEKRYAEQLQQKIATFIESTSTRKNVIITLISTYGVKSNAYADIVQREVTLDQLFK